MNNNPVPPQNSHYKQDPARSSGKFMKLIEMNRFSGTLRQVNSSGSLYSNFRFARRRYFVFSTKEQYMDLLRKTGLILSLAFGFSLPITVSAADEAAAVAPLPEQSVAQFDPPMHNLMWERHRDQHPGKCKTKQDAAADNEVADSAPAMGKGPCYSGKHCEYCQHRDHCMLGGHCKPREHCKHGGGMPAEGKPCMQGRHENCHMRGDAGDTRLDMLEKRLDLMQSMLEKLMRDSGK
jgi:hypothetical protein